MNLYHYHKGVALAIACIAFQFIPNLLSEIKLFYFVPFLIVMFYQLTFIGSLWISLACGFFIDCLSAHSFFGLNAFVYVLTTMLLYQQRRYFFSDRLTTLPVMTYLFSTCATVFLIICAMIFENKLIFSWSFIYQDLILMPAADSIYAFIVFVFPYQLYKQIQSQRKLSLRKSH